MGIILTTALVLALASAFIEFKLFYSVPFLRKLVEKSTAIGIAMSVFLSFVIGTLFGAAGLIVMVAALVSTMMTEPVHSVMRRAKRRPQQTEQTRSVIDEYRATWGWVFSLIRVSFKVVTFPIWFPVKVRRWWMQSAGSPTSATT